MAFFYLIRHGETEWNAERRLAGRSDVCLSETGQIQARLVASRLRSFPAAAIYSSPLRRALETATIIGNELNIKPIEDHRLIEMAFGSWEGKAYSEIIKGDSLLFSQWDKDPGNFRPPGGESGREAMARGAEFLDFVRDKHRNGNAILVSHRTMCRLIISYALELNSAEFRRRIAQESAAVNIIQYTKHGWRLVLLNDIAHLGKFHTEHTSVEDDF